jgi:uncharacterized protein YacL
MEGFPYVRSMMEQAQQDQVTRAARRAVLIDGLPVATLGAVALALGSSPDQSATEKAWWIATAAVFTLAVAWVLLRAFRRADEYLRKIQLESMAIAFAAVLVGLQVATLLDSAGVIALHLLVQPILIGGVMIWLGIADLRTRLHR